MKFPGWIASPGLGSGYLYQAVHTWHSSPTEGIDYQTRINNTPGVCPLVGWLSISVFLTPKLNSPIYTYFKGTYFCNKHGIGPCRDTMA